MFLNQTVVQHSPLRANCPVFVFSGAVSSQLEECQQFLAVYYTIGLLPLLRCTIRISSSRQRIVRWFVHCPSGSQLVICRRVTDKHFPCRLHVIGHGNKHIWCRGREGRREGGREGGITAAEVKGSHSYSLCPSFWLQYHCKVTKHFTVLIVCWPVLVACSLKDLMGRRRRRKRREKKTKKEKANNDKRQMRDGDSEKVLQGCI